MIAIIDYGVGNLASVNKAFSFIGEQSIITADKNEILSADGVILPGVGAFADAMQGLVNSGMVSTIKQVANKGTPLLGICLGMQLLFEYSTEGTEQVQGLGLIDGGIHQFPLDMGLKVPHMGWNNISIKNDSTIFKGIAEDSFVYFVHSYCLDDIYNKSIAATSIYGIEFGAAVSCKNIMGTQFHPEKSGDVGLNILRNFASICRGEFK